MTTERHDPQMEELQDFLTQHAQFNGAKILSFLISFTGHEFHCTKLSHLVFPPDFDRLELLAEQADLQDTLTMYADKDEQHETVSVRAPGNPQLIAAKQLDVYDLADLITCRHYDNPLTDIQTLKDISLRIKKLKRDIANNLNPEQAHTEIQALYKYRSQCLMPGNKIKHFNPEIIKTYQTLYQSISRLLSKLPATQTHLLDYVKKHLKTGVEFVWR